MAEACIGILLRTRQVSSRQRHWGAALFDAVKACMALDPARLYGNFGYVEARILTHVDRFEFGSVEPAGDSPERAD
jgi:hypothetical protein